jgi:hypothetical protein
MKVVLEERRVEVVVVHFKVISKHSLKGFRGNHARAEVRTGNSSGRFKPDIP